MHSKFSDIAEQIIERNKNFPTFSGRNDENFNIAKLPIAQNEMMKNITNRMVGDDHHEAAGPAVVVDDPDHAQQQSGDAHSASPLKPLQYISHDSKNKLSLNWINAMHNLQKCDADEAIRLIPSPFPSNSAAATPLFSSASGDEIAAHLLKPHVNTFSESSVAATLLLPGAATAASPRDHATPADSAPRSPRALSPRMEDESAAKPSNFPQKAELPDHQQLPPQQQHKQQPISGHSATCLQFPRVKIEGNNSEASGLGHEDLRFVAESLVVALKLRQKYMSNALQSFNKTTARYVDVFNPDGEHAEMPKDEDRCHELAESDLNSLKDEDHPINPMPTEGNPYEIAKQKACYRDLNGQYALEWNNGIMRVRVRADQSESSPTEAAAAAAASGTIAFDSELTYEDFFEDHALMSTFVSDGPLKTFCYQRLRFLDYKFHLHTMMNDTNELMEQKRVPHRDFYNIRKVDTHIHAASCMNQKHLLRFIKKHARDDGNEVVCVDDKKRPLTMTQLFESLNMNPGDLNIDKLDVHADRNTFHRFDKFNSKYNPVGESKLREVFLKIDNYCKGRYFAKLLREVMSDLEESKYQNTELRLSIYGRSMDEWDRLAKWAVDFNVYSDNNKWMIQMPRLYDVFRSKGQTTCFQDVLSNFFRPLFEVSLSPDSHPELHAFLAHVSGFDSVDDESKQEQNIKADTATPAHWTDEENPPYAYYIFYMYANMSVLNKLRAHRRLNTFTLRPHCGEAGSITHLISGFLLCENINHGLMLRKTPVLQYLFYLAQIGIAMSPLSNNSLFLEYNRNPLSEFLNRGLQVSLSTDDPLQFHFTKEPLMEEYSIAAQVWKMGSVAMCELARNSVLMSGFTDDVKSHWLGMNFGAEGCQGNDILRTNVPNVRIAYRHESLFQELVMLLSAVIRFNIADS